MEMDFPMVNQDLPTDVVVVSSIQNYLYVKSIDLDIDEITKDVKYISNDTSQITSLQTWKSMQERLAIYINVMGQKSAHAQGLKEPITTATKLIQSDQRLYMIKDALTNNGSGALVGILKVGVKKLFLSDGNGDQVTRNPLCLLDFYVDESRQRQGYGFKLFKVMLQLEGITPVQLAIDRPSQYLLCFLKKHYKMEKPQYHPNKYVIFPGFFRSEREVASDSTGQKEIRSLEKNQKAVYLNRNSVCNVPSSSISCRDIPPVSPSVVKSTQRTALAPTRFDTERKWQEMYNSWNVLGVPPHDYSYVQHGRAQPSESEIRKTVLNQSVFPK